MSDEELQFLAITSPWKGNQSSVWLASTIKLRRNVEKFKFPGKLDTERRKQIIALISKELMSTQLFTKPRLLKAEEVSPLDKQFLVEHFFSLENYLDTHQGEAFIIDEEARLFMTFNVDDHIHFQHIDFIGELENSWNALVHAETTLGKVIAYSYSPRFGFLTADPTHCGTGMQVLIFLQVPGLIHSEKLNDALEQLKDESILTGGLQGEPTNLVGDILVVQNNYKLGINEENILASLRSYVTKLMIEENSARVKIKKDDNAHIKDLVSRAFAILIHSYQIEAVEALNALSLLKLGVELGWVEGISIAEINTLFFNCRRAHLLYVLKEKLTQEEIPHKRAAFIHEKLKNVSLVI